MSRFNVRPTGHPELDKVQHEIRRAFDALNLGGTQTTNTTVGPITVNPPTPGGSGGTSSLAPTGVVPGTYDYATVTVNAYGQTTFAESGNPSPSLDAFYLVNQAANMPPNGIDLSTFGAGVLQQTVSGGVATINVSSLASDCVPFAGGWGQLLSDSGLKYFTGGSGGLVVSQRIVVPEVGTQSATALTFKVNSSTRGGFDSSGHAYFTDLSTGTPTLVGATDATGHIANVTVGSGLSLASGTLSAAPALTADQVVFGDHSGSGAFAQSASLLFNSSNGRFGIQNTTGSMTASTIPRQFTSISDGVNNFSLLGNYTNTATGQASIRLERARGTFASQTALQHDDLVGQVFFAGHNGTLTNASIALSGRVNGTATIDSTHMPIDFGIYVNRNILTEGTAYPQFAVSWNYDVVLGAQSLSTGDTSGFVYMRSMAGTPTGTPTVPSLYNITLDADQTVTGVPLVIDTSHSPARLYGNFSGSWHYASFDDGAALGYHYLTTQAESGLSNEFSLGALTSGVLMQTVTGSVSTPQALLMTTGYVPFGNSSGTLSQAVTIKYDTTKHQLGLSSDANGVDASLSANFGPLVVGGESGFQAAQFYFSANSVVAPAHSFEKSRGSRATPAAVQASDSLGSTVWRGHDGTSYVSTHNMAVSVEPGGTVAAASIPAIWAVSVNGGANSLNVNTQQAIGVHTNRDVWLGEPNIAAASSNGFVHVPTVSAAAPSGVPTYTFGSSRTQNRTPLVASTLGNGRLYAYVGGAWHYTVFDDGVPFTAADTTISFPTSTTIKVSQLSNKFIVQGTSDSMLTGAQFTGSLATGLLKNTTSTGVLSIAAAGTDYVAPWSLTSGSVVFSGGGSTLSQDNSNFFWDGTNHRLGLGTTSPATTLDVEGRITIGPHATGPRVQMLNPDNLASLAQVQFYPGDGTNTGTSFAVVPKGTGFSSSIKAQFSVFNTDFIADSTNYEFCVFRAAGTEFDLLSSKAGTGTARPLNIQASTTGASVSNKGITFNTDGSVTIGNGTLTVQNFSSSGFVKTNSSGVLSVDTNTYLSATLTTGDILYAASSSSVGQDSTFTFDSTNHILSTKRQAITGHDSGSSINAALVFNEAADQGITKSGGVLYFGTTSSHSVTFVTNSTSRGSWDNSGNLTLTANTPQLALGGNNGDSIGSVLLLNQAAHDQAITKTGGTFYLATGDAHSIAFVTNSTSRGSIDSSGNLNWGNYNATWGDGNLTWGNGNWVAGVNGGAGTTLLLNCETNYFTVGSGGNQIKVGLYVGNSYPQYANIGTDQGYFGSWLIGYGAQQFGELWVASGGTNTLHLGYGGAADPFSTTDVITINGGSSGSLSFWGGTGSTRGTITGSRSSGAAVASLLTYLQTLGLIIDSSSP